MWLSLDVVAEVLGSATISPRCSESVGSVCILSLGVATEFLGSATIGPNALNWFVHKEVKYFQAYK